MPHRGRTVKAGAIYCRIPHPRDEDQPAVDEQERRCRESAAALGVRVNQRHVYIDNRRLAWQPDRRRPGWQAMFAAAASGEFGHLFLDPPGGLLRTPCDLVEVIRVATRAASHCMAAWMDRICWTRRRGL